MSDLSPDIRTCEGYMLRFWALVSEYSNTRAPMRNALNSLESELYASYRVRRYASYRSFSTVKGRKRGGPSFPNLKTVQLEIVVLEQL